MRPTLTTLTTKSERWLLRVTLGSRVLRFCTGKAVVITGKDGKTYRYVGGLSPTDFERALDMTASPTPRSQSFTVLPDFDVALMFMRGTSPSAGTGELSRWYEGAAYEERSVVLDGRMQDPAYGPKGDPFSFAISEDPGEDKALVPPVSWVVAEGVTFIDSGVLGPDPTIVGATYPLVIGAPGQSARIGGTSNTFTDDAPGTPALQVIRDGSAVSTTLTDYRILICAGETCEASQVRIVNLTDVTKTFDATTIVSATDGLNQRYWYVNPTAGNIPAEGDEIYTIWNPANGGGIRNPFGTGTLRGAGDVIRWALAESDVRIDTSAHGELDILNNIKIDTHINGSISPYDWLMSQVVPILPVTVTTGPRGLVVKPLILRTVDKSQATIHLEHGRNCTRAGQVLWNTEDIANDITISFGPNASTGATTMRRRAHGFDYDSADPDSSPNYWCRRSLQELRGQMGPNDTGVRYLDVDGSVLFDVPSAEAALQEIVIRRSMPTMEVIYDLPRGEEGVIPGDVVSVTDAGVHLSASIGVVGPVQQSAESTRIQVVFYAPLVFTQ